MVRKLGLRRCDTGCMIEMHLLLSYWYTVLCIQQHGISVETEHEFAFSVVQTHCLQLEDPDSLTCLFMAICYTHSHTTKKQKLKSTSGSIPLLECDLFLFAASFILVWMCLGSSKTVVAACELAQYAPSLQFLPVY